MYGLGDKLVHYVSGLILVVALIKVDKRTAIILAAFLLVMHEIVEVIILSFFGTAEALLIESQDIIFDLIADFLGILTGVFLMRNHFKRKFRFR